MCKRFNLWKKLIDKSLVLEDNDYINVKTFTIVRL